MLLTFAMYIIVLYSKHIIRLGNFTIEVKENTRFIHSTTVMLKKILTMAHIRKNSEKYMRIKFHDRNNDMIARSHVRVRILLNDMTEYSIS